jgi:hypothetical protein
MPSMKVSVNRKKFQKVLVEIKSITRGFQFEKDSPSPHVEFERSINELFVAEGFLVNQQKERVQKKEELLHEMLTNSDIMKLSFRVEIDKQENQDFKRQDDFDMGEDSDEMATEVVNNDEDSVDGDSHNSDAMDIDLDENNPQHAKRAWTELEKFRFGEAVEIHKLWKKWTLIARYVGTRNAEQVRSHSRTKHGQSLKPADGIDDDDEDGEIQL